VHRLRITATSELIPDNPEWYGSVVPETFAALREAAIVVVVGRSSTRLEALRETVRSQSAATVLPACPSQDDTGMGSAERPVSPATPRAISSRLRSELATVRVDGTLPYGDEARALISRLYDRRRVSSVEYGDEIEFTVEIPEDVRQDLRRRVGAAGGRLDSAGPS
jgi:hypothetical protein